MHCHILTASLRQFPPPQTAGDRNRPSTGFNHSESSYETECPLPRGGMSNTIYRIQCDSCEVKYVGETGKRLQIGVIEHVLAVRSIDPLSLVAEHCTNSRHTLAFQNTGIMGQGNDRVTRETLEAWHTETTSTNHCVTLPVAYQALWAHLIELKSEHEIRPNVNPTTGDPRTTPQSRADEGAVINTAASTTTLIEEETCIEKDTNRTSNLGRQYGRGRRLPTVKRRPSTKDLPTDSNYPPPPFFVL
ncbi:unnamed protein product [Schistocephalus solidus]|uniref:GIY-YIG domain-containing protein n=1 Tax=Schistocephalus solidus TaxID=70667 RepID=A0A183SNF2_SCHSO|nr:unnamed protein product [Schistocephalus solidus]